MAHNLTLSIKTSIVALLGAGFLSCTGEVPVELPPFEEKLVLEAYFVAGDTMIVRLDRATNPYMRNVSRQDPSRLVKGANVQVSSPDTTIQLIENPAFTLGHSGILYSAGLTVEESARYSVTVDYQGFHVQSECAVPAFTEILGVQLNASFESVSTSNGQRYKSAFDLNLAAQFPQSAAYYLLEVSGKTTAGPFTTLLAVPFQTTDQTGSDPVGFVGLVSYKLPYLPTEYVVSLFRIDALYYEYLKAVESQQGEYNSFLVSETTRVPTNIVGGLGIFAGMSRDTVKVTIQ